MGNIGQNDKGKACGGGYGKSSAKWGKDADDEKSKARDSKEREKNNGRLKE